MKVEAGAATYDLPSRRAKACQACVMNRTRTRHAKLFRRRRASRLGARPGRTKLVRRLGPVQLSPQHREVIVILRVKQANPVGGTSNLDSVALGERVMRLPVGMKARILAAQERNRHHRRI